MRKIAFALFLAGAAAATPALAERPNWHKDDSRPARAERPARDNSAPARPQAQRAANVQRSQYYGSQSRANFQRPQFSGARPMGNADARDSVRNWRPREQQVRQQGGYLQQEQVRQQAVSGGGTWAQRRYGDSYAGRANYAGRDRVVSNGTRSPFRAEGGRSGRVQWNTGWRNDRRYDWRERRYRNRSLFHLGLYVDPFGWGYQPYSIGYDLQPGYYQQNYWIDPALYGLPFPPPGAQWVRYWNDAVLVDMYSGEIIDSIPGFFW